MSAAPAANASQIDDHVDDEIGACLDLDRPTSFFLFAGAGSGKTRSLVKALVGLRQRSGARLRLHGQQVGVITYTNAACDEIKRRIDHDPLFYVATIHSFVWELIAGLTDETRKVIAERLQEDIGELEEQERKGKAGSKASADRQRSLEAKKERLALLPKIKRFVYSPTGDNRGRDALNHAEVLAIGAALLTRRPLMQSLLIGRFPILLIDESQDTNADLMDAFLAVQASRGKAFCLGLFGDMMQRIYADGKKDLGRNLPSDWATPSKKLNHRCPHRIVTLINRIRSEVDGQAQQSPPGIQQGHARLFVRPASSADKYATETAVREQMAITSGDALWRDTNRVKTLILEHHMAAKRLKFADLFLPLYQVDAFKVSLLNGEFAPLRFLVDQVLPLAEASRAGNAFQEAAIVRKYSPLLNRDLLAAAGSTQAEQLKKARAAVAALVATLAAPAPTCLSVLQCVEKHNLFTIPESLIPVLANPTDQEEPEEVKGLRAFLSAPFAQVSPYAEYVAGRAPLDTHQGVKGLEFPRVLVLMDDEEAGGFLFSFDKLFGAKAKSKTDIDNEDAGKETGIDRTRRLFYVTCSRSQSSLALLAYSSNPRAVRDKVVERGWFDSTEVDLGQ